MLGVAQSEIAQERHNAVILHLRQQVEDLQRIVDDPTPQDTIRVLQTKLESTKVLEDNLKRELSDLRQAKEDAVVARDQAILAHKSDKSAMLTTIRTLKADISSFQRQRETAELNAQKLNNTASESARRVEHLEKDVARLKRQVRSSTSSDRLSPDMHWSGTDIPGWWDLWRGCISCPPRNDTSRVQTQLRVSASARRLLRGMLSVVTCRYGHVMWDVVGCMCCYA